LLERCIAWPPALAAQYRAQGYWRGETLGAHLRRWANLRPQSVAIIAGARHVTYAELDRRADIFACRFEEHGLRDRDRIVVQLGNSPEFFALLFGCFRLGVIPILALPGHRENEIAHFASHGRASGYAVAATRRFDYLALAKDVRERVPSLRHILVDSELSAWNEAGPVDRQPDRGQADDVALFLLSGGTTGYPKLIPRTHDDYAYNFRRSAEIAGFDESTRYLVALPISHNFPLGSPGALGVFENGGTVVLTDDPSAANALPLMERERITHTAVVPTIALRWMESPVAASVDLSRLRVLQVGGARLPEEVARKVGSRLGCQLQQVFGMAEGLLNFTRLDDPEELIVSTQGCPMCPDDELRLIDEEGRDVPEGLPGELLVRGPYTLRGYYNAPDHNTRSFTEDGYYRSGDVVRRLPTGHLVVEGRVKDLINRGGEKISAEDVENHLLAHPRVREVAVVAMPDREFGERACAVIVTRDGAPLALAEIVAFLSGRRIAKALFPERVETLEALPLTNVGKIDKKRLRQIVAGKLSETGCA
jgi:2,3-dihydroxybenzoate-AMP ligase